MKSVICICIILNYGMLLYLVTSRYYILQTQSNNQKQEFNRFYVLATTNCYGVLFRVGMRSEMVGWLQGYKKNVNFNDMLMK